jgi:hypothetical protein
MSPCVGERSTDVIRVPLKIALKSRHMELKRLITHFTYRIELKPEGGFIAHATDPTVPPLEAPTREELQRKIQANIAAGLASEFPGLKLPLENQELKFAFHIERKPGGGFAIHSADPNAQPIEGMTHEEIENHFAEKLIAFVGKHFMPVLSQTLAAQGNSGDIRVFVTRKTGFNAGSQTSRLGIVRDLPPAGSLQPDDAKIEDARLGDAKTTNANFGSVGDTIGNSPITPESSSSWTIFRFLLASLIIAALMYFFLYHR